MTQDRAYIEVNTTKVTYSLPGHSPGTAAIHTRIFHSPVNFTKRTELRGQVWNPL